METTKQKIAAILSNILQLSLAKKFILLAIVFGVAYFSWIWLHPKTTQPQYQTAQAEKGTLVTSVTTSGTIAAGNSVAITTQATGVVSNVYVKNGDTVSQGQKIADLTLDPTSQQKQAAAYATYLSAVNSQKQAEQNKLSLDASMWSDHDAVLAAQADVDIMKYNISNGIYNPTTKQPYSVVEQNQINDKLTQARKAFDASEKKYTEADSSIASAKASVGSTNLALQLISPSIVAPASGVISSLNLVAGLPITGNTTSTASSSTSTSSSQSLGTVTLDQGQLQATVNLSEIDVTKVNTGQKVTLTLDAFPGKTFTGVVSSINTNGLVSSGVTTYPTTITIDSTEAHIYPNMAVSAKIITNVKDNVVMVPNQAVQSQNGQTTVRVIRNGQVQNVPVEVGDASDTQTEIIAGINEGEIVVTSTSTTTNTKTGGSVFGGAGGFGAIRGGGFGVGGNRGGVGR